jgi:hypothetical protein
MKEASMGAYRSLIARLSVSAAVAGSVLVGAAQVGQAPVPLPLEPVRDAGLSVTPAFEGWYPNPDGTSTILLGYMNRNRVQVVDIPIGPNNRIEPGGPDYGQPTHFLPRRQWGLVAIVVPKDFGTKRLTWTIVTNGETNTIPVWLNPKYVIEPFKAAANGDTPPVIRFEPNGRPLQGPPIGVARTLTATVNQPLPLTVWVTDKGPDMVDEEPPAAAGRGGQERPRVTVKWVLNRGADAVKFDPPEPKIDEKDGGKATTTAAFSQPGEYGIRAQANDITGDGGGGNQCCWTNAFVKVTVTP